MISRRALKVVESTDFLLEWNALANKNKYDPVKNKTIEECTGEGDTSDFGVYSFHGTQSLRENISGFLNTFMNTKVPIDPQELIVVNGTSAVFDILSVALADSGEYFLCPAPYFSRIRNSLADEGNVMCYDVPLDMNKIEDENPNYISEIFHTYYEKAKEEGCIVKGIVLINPDNPTGKVYGENELRALLDFSKRNNLHLILDEIYAFSFFGSGIFRSILSFEDIPDTVHFVWGLSKDFGLIGYRCGILWSRNVSAIDFAKKVALYHCMPINNQRTLSNLFSDTDWIKNVYLPTYSQRLKNAHQTTVGVFRRLEARVFRSSGGVYVWINLSKFMKRNTFTEEIELFRRLFDGGVFCTPGKEFYCAEPGWFRVVITNYDTHFQEGLRRIETVLKEA